MYLCIILQVVPLTQRSGILEWCHNTMPIATILIGNDGISGVHKKYNPHDYTALMCRKKMDVRLWNISYLHACFTIKNK